MNARNAERSLARYSGLTESDVDQRMRPLRDKGLLPTGGRGPHAPEIEEDSAALMMLQLVSRRAVDAFSVGLIAADQARMVPYPCEPQPFGVPTPSEGVSLHTALIFLLQNPDFAWSRLVVACDGRTAWLTIRPELVLVFSAEHPAPPASVAAYDKLGSAYFGPTFTLSAAVVKNIAADLRQPPEKRSGWTGEG